MRLLTKRSPVAPSSGISRFHVVGRGQIRTVLVQNGLNDWYRLARHVIAHISNIGYQQNTRTVAKTKENKKNAVVRSTDLENDFLSNDIGLGLKLCNIYVNNDLIVG